jgi:predicted RNase H-like nuclease (RuvC/YqgF family)
MNEEYIKKLEAENKLLTKTNADLQDRINKLEDDCSKYKRDRAILISQVNANKPQVKKDPENIKWIDFTKRIQKQGFTLSNE